MRPERIGAVDLTPLGLGVEDLLSVAGIVGVLCVFFGLVILVGSFGRSSVERRSVGDVEGERASRGSVL